MAVEPRIYFIDGREIHLFGNYVGVVWNLEDVREERQTQRTQANGAIETVTETRTLQRREKGTEGAYIDFLTIQEEDDDAWIDEDSPVEGGLHPVFAKKIHRALGDALAYLDGLLKGD